MMECVSVKDDRPLHELRFDAAVKVIQSLPPDGSFQPSNDMMLKFYSYYKQATIGPCKIPRPGFWDPVGKAKWDAWSSLEDMSKEQAMKGYVDEMKLILEGMPITDEVEQLLQVMGPFYELVDEKKKLSQVSDLTTARLTKFARQLEGFGTTLGSMPSKSVTMSIIRTLEMNGTLETRPARLAPPNHNNILEVEQKAEEIQEDDDDIGEEDEEEDVEIRESKQDQKTAVSQAKKKGSARKPKVPGSNGRVGNGLAHQTNGTHSSKSALNSDDSEEGFISTSLLPELQVNGHHTDPCEDVSGPHHLASDSDSEVYCDSMDQFGLEEGSDEQMNCSLDLEEGEEGESHSPLSSQEEPQAGLGAPGVEQDLPEGMQCGGEEPQTGGAASYRQRQSTERPDSSLVRRSRGSRSSSQSSGAQGPTQGSGGNGDRWGAAVPPGGSLNEQIVVALARLQEDMQSVLERLHTLEALTASQARSLALSPNYTSTPAKKSSKKPSWWPFDVSPSTVAFAVLWPFVVQWLIRVYFQRRRRRIN
ncbi:acyl-CoA-binding domain-containing protein 5A isoform X1 [Osmerus eperlanus]